jgi:signal transduction histidine kinase
MPADVESRRVAALREYGLLDRTAPPEIEALVRVAAQIAGVPTAAVNLIDETWQCAVAPVGFAGGRSPRSVSLCARHFLSGRVVCVPDARSVPDYADSPWVTGALGNVRFYASIPLTGEDGDVLGTLCLFDVVERHLDDAQLSAVRDLGTVLVGLLERQRQARRNAALAVEAESQRARYSLAVRELEARTELIRAVLDRVEVAIVAAGPDGRLSLFNRAAFEWHGLPADASLDPDEQAGHYDLFEADGVTPLHPDQVPLRRALVDGEVHDVEIVLAPAGLPARHVVCSGRSMARANGTPLGAVVAMADVTADRRQRAALEDAHEQLSRRRSELERSNAELADFAAVASHDMRSPLSVIDGYLALLLDVYGGQMEARAKDWVGIARTAVARMLSLTEALLTYAQVGGSVPVRAPVDVEETLGQVLLDLEAQVASAGATVQAAGPLPEIDVDPVLFRQLLQNLVANAVTHRDHDRPCRVTVSVTASPVPGGRGWTVSVADNGRGVPAEHRDLVFGMFTKAHAGDRSGTGIGLATCARIVEHHGGSIWIEETPGGGATVCFTVREEQVPAPSPALVPARARLREDECHRPVRL